MAAVFTPDSLILAVLTVIAGFLVAVVVTTPPGVLPRFVRGRRYHRAGRARHAAARPVAAPMPVLETVPDPVSPFAPRAV